MPGVTAGVDEDEGCLGCNNAVEPRALFVPDFAVVFRERTGGIGSVEWSFEGPSVEFWGLGCCWLLCAKLPFVGPAAEEGSC